MQKSALDKGPKPLPTASENHDVTEKDRLLPDHIAITILASTPPLCQGNIFSKKLDAMHIFSTFCLRKTEPFFAKKAPKVLYGKMHKKTMHKIHSDSHPFHREEKNRHNKGFL